MAKKYIIEKDDNESIWSIYADKDGDATIEGVSLTPYTEPDLEQVRKEAYSNGYDAACRDIDIKSKTNAAYRKGLEDVWCAVGKISNMYSEERRKIFGENFIQKIFVIYSASEVIEKIRQYEQGQEIKVGDEVISEDDIKAVVIDMDDYLLHVLDENGLIQGWPREDVVKTDRHFPDIATVLKKMKEVQK